MPEPGIARHDWRLALGLERSEHGPGLGFSLNNPPDHDAVAGRAHQAFADQKARERYSVQRQLSAG